MFGLNTRRTVAAGGVVLDHFNLRVAIEDEQVSFRRERDSSHVAEFLAQRRHRSRAKVERQHRHTGRRRGGGGGRGDIRGVGSAVSGV